MINFIIVLVAYTLGAWLYSIPFVGDQKVYIATAKEMWEQGIVLHPYLFGETTYFKPPWVYWTIITGWKIFGFNLFGTFFFSALATALTSLILDSISNDLNRTKQRYPLAGIWFAGCTGTLTYGTSAQMEIWVVFFYSLAWFYFLKHFKSGQMKSLVLGLLVSGISAWNKSPLYSVFSVLGYSIYLFFAPEGKGPTPESSPRSWFLKPNFYLAHLIGVAAGLSWFVLIWFSDKDRFWSHYILQETLGKQVGNSGSLLHMWLDFSTFTLPFSLLIIPIFLRIPEMSKNKLFFLLSWCLIPAVFFSIFPYKTETYLYILIPALALLLDWGLEDCTDKLKRWTVKLNGLLIGLGLLTISILFTLTGLINYFGILFTIITGISFFIASGWFLSNSKKINPIPLAFSALGLIFALRICALSLGEKDIQNLRTITKRFPNRKLAFLDADRNIWHEIGLLSVATSNPALRLHTTGEALQALQNKAILVLNSEQAQLFTLKNIPDLQNISWWRLQRHFAVPSLIDLRQLGDRKNQREFKLFWK